jgi:hypothetical protein
MVGKSKAITCRGQSYPLSMVDKLKAITGKEDITSHCPSVYHGQCIVLSFLQVVALALSTMDNC